MELRCCIFNNMNSGKNRKYRYNKDKFLQFVPDDFRIIDAYSLNDLNEAVHVIKDEGINMLMVNGGDGTLQQLLTALINAMPADSLPIILPLRGGTSNTVQGAIGVRKNPIDTVKILLKHLELYDKGEDSISSLSVKPLKLTDSKYGIKYGFTFTNGLVYRVQKLYTEQENPTFTTVINLITSTIGGYAIGHTGTKKYYSKINAELYIDGNRYPEQRYLLMFAAVFQRLLLWFKPFYQPEKKGINNFYFIASAVDPWIAIKNLRAFTTGKEIPPHTFNGVPSNVRINAECGYALDGELVNDEYTDIILEEGPLLKFFVVPETIRTSYGITYKAYINPEHVNKYDKDNLITFSLF